MLTVNFHESSAEICRGKDMKKILSVMLFLSLAKLYAATPVDFFATVSTSQDTNMISMTTDLFYSQLQSIDGYSVNDKRTISYSSSAARAGTIAFYAEIQESDGGWVCTLNAIKVSTQTIVSETKKYASYYKILMDAKTSLENLLANLASGGTALTDSAALSVADSPALSSADAESLAGTWGGEAQVDKIVILRGGKGFVIFKNGASMNISITVSGSSIIISQLGRFNASYFPDLPREVALQNASSAEPVTWTLTLTDGNTLSGTKKTLVQDSSSATGASFKSLPVEWTRR